MAEHYLREPVNEQSIRGADDEPFEAAMKAFHKGPPGIIRKVQHIDSYPGERVAPDDPPDPSAYQPLRTSGRAEREAIADSINAYVEPLVQQLEQMKTERQAVLDCINLYGDETLHKALDGIGFLPRDGAH